MPRYFLGIDGGQSSTTAVIGDESGNVIGRGTGGPCNHVAAAEAKEKFSRAINGSLGEACQSAQLDVNTLFFAGACLGFSGGPEDKEAYTRALIRSQRYKITHDAEIALTGAHAGAPGIIIIAGTGSMAFGRNAEGKTARAGGWGYIFGDEGGAFDLVKRAVRSVLAAEEGWGAQTLLSNLLLNAAGFATANQLLHGFYTPQWDRARIAKLAPLVTQAAETGDACAMQIIEAAAAKLAWYVQGVYAHIFEDEHPPVATVGGAFQSNLLRDGFVRHVLELTGCAVVLPKLGPAEGALLEAMRLALN
ncbi:MAG TPA: BadF/BadG/BcrA/BcrD ATPase family protein [Bryobacteraceae bacterium]|jgi:N-acetylglucosamine kinase-like BadF-type ATPase|nr:BadF/BadG/BcrA/BcrD ATPase family protein [Bryobacteraceae bacterium]